MPVVFVIARDWKLRAAVRAELREMGIEALGMDSAEEAGRALASGKNPVAVVLEASAEIAADRAIEALLQRVPSVVVASRTETVPLPTVAAVLYRPVRVSDIVASVRNLIEQGQAS
jgi:hypothetical protein